VDDLLPDILDALIPPSADGRMPGAGALGLAGTVGAALDPNDASLRAGFEALRRAGFDALDAAARQSALAAVERDHPAFVPALYTTACSAYYQHPAVHRALGLPGEPPHPRGFELEAGDLAGLERVKARGPIYREV